jgi:hypothetical protein
LIKITDEIPLLLAIKDKFVTLNIFGWKFSVDFPTRENWSTECAGLVAPNELIFFMDLFMDLLMDLFARAELVLAYSLTF